MVCQQWRLLVTKLKPASRTVFFQDLAVYKVPCANAYTCKLQNLELSHVVLQYRCKYCTVNNLSGLNLIFKVARTKNLTYSEMYKHRVKLYRHELEEHFMYTAGIGIGSFH